jgi:hypothetical protein
MKIKRDFASLVDDLAALWTEPVLEIMKASGVNVISVDMEIETWRTLRRVVHAQLRWQRAFRYSTLVSIGMVMQDAIREVTLLLMARSHPCLVSSQFEGQIRLWAGERRSTATERRLSPRSHVSLLCALHSSRRAGPNSPRGSGCRRRWPS